MKKRISILLFLLFLIPVLAGCSFFKGSEPDTDSQNQKTVQEQTAGKEEEAADQQAEEEKEKNTEAAAPETKTDSGTYVGLIDSNSIEIKISSVPEEEAARAFRLGDEVRENFEERFGLQSGDQVRFTYIPKENEQPVLIKIEKI